jgi:hypothetical protein
MSNRPPPPPPRGRRTTPRPRLKPPPLPRTESRRLSSLPWLPHARPWTRLGRKRAAALTWEKEKTIARHLEQQLAAAQGITIPQDDDDDRSVDAGSNPDAALTAHLHVQAAGLQNIRSVVTIVLEPSSPDYKWWRDLVLLMLRRYTLDDHVLSDVADPFIYWARLDSIMVTWILGTLSPELHEIVREPTETARQAWLAIEAQFLGNSESRILQLDARFRAFK